MSKDIGFIGLGIMGKPMALNLMKKGFSLHVLDINENAVKEVVQYGARTAQTPQKVAQNSDVIITMLPSDIHVKQVILGENGVINGTKKGTIVVDMSSLNPQTSCDIASELQKNDVYFLDAPVSGGEPKAIDGTLAIMVGGDETAFNKTKNIMQSMGQSVTYVGKSGSGCATKLANQIIVNLNIAAMSEAFVLITKLGLDPTKVYEAIRGGLAGSTVLDAKVPMVINRNFEPGGRIDINLKDINNVLQVATSNNLELPLTSQVLHIFNTLKEEGKLNKDHSAIIQYYEKLANVQVGGKND